MPKKIEEKFKLDNGVMKSMWEPPTMFQLYLLQQIQVNLPTIQFLFFFLIRLFVESQIQNEESSMNYQLSDQLTATTTVPHPMPTRKSILLQ